MGTCWRKRSRFLCNTHLAGQTFWCSRQHKHVPLQGWCKAKGVSWTRLAQTYPKRLCILLAKSLLIDSGMLPGRGKIQMSAISRVEHARIGEASHPGPRRPKAVHKRQDVNLDSVRLVEPSTLRLGKNIWHGFLRWLSAEFDRDSIYRIIGVPEVLSVLVSEFGKHLFETGQSIYLYRQLVTHIQHEGQARSSLANLEPVGLHRTGLPPHPASLYALFRAMVSTAVHLKWFRFAGVMILTFEALCRPGETLNAERSDLLLPEDLFDLFAERILMLPSSEYGSQRVVLVDSE